MANGTILESIKPLKEKNLTIFKFINQEQEDKAMKVDRSENLSYFRNLLKL